MEFAPVVPAALFNERGPPRRSARGAGRGARGVRRNLTGNSVARPRFRCVRGGVRRARTTRRRRVRHEVAGPSVQAAGRLRDGVSGGGPSRRGEGSGRRQLLVSLRACERRLRAPPATVAHVVQAARQHVLQEAPQKLLAREGHGAPRARW